jgi:para-aminobenzoate synthetase/4-amino-4-deoxychorismate lyase
MKRFLSAISERKLAAILVQLAREDNFVFLETTRVNEENHLSYLFLAPIDRLVCRPDDDPVNFLARAQQHLDQGHYLAGWISYEFGYRLEPVLAGLIPPGDQSLAEFGVYAAPFIYDHRIDDFIGLSPWPELADSVPLSSPACRISNLAFSENKDDYLQNIARIKRYIESGDTYQVNYTLKLLFGYSGSDGDLYRTLRRNQSVAYGAMIRDGDQRILSFSPELFFRKKGDDCVVRPMKGTSRRAPGLDEDLQLRGSLATDIKNRSENVMIVDLLRNDLGRLCVPGKVDVLSLFDIETYETLHQMTSSIKGQLRSDVTLAELFRAIFPCGSVTGAPKIRTMEIIRELEGGPRGVYTGGIGFISPDGEAVFNVPIRTIVLDKEHGEMGIGSGIVYDSDPADEWDECCLKGRFLTEPFPEFKLIETILHSPGQGFWLLERHLERLERSATYWGFPFRRDEITAALAEVAAGNAAGGEQRVRLLLDRSGELEVSGVPCQAPSTEDDERPKVMVAAQPTDSSDQFLFHKTTCRQLYDREREKATAAGFLDVLFCNQRSEVTEGAISNVFILRNGELLTPPLKCGLLPGILRAALLAGEVAGPDDLPVREAVLSIEDLQAAEAVYVGNSVRGLIRVELTSRSAEPAADPDLRDPTR